MGKHTGGVLVARSQFVRENPKLYAAFCAAQDDTNAFIKAHPRDAAAIYLEMSKNKRQSVDELAALITDPLVDYTTTPIGIMVQAKFLLDTGRVKEIPPSWKEYFFPNIQALPGS
jgi:NitT/TauT family transport system substrate-binding protein